MTSSENPFHDQDVQSWVRARLTQAGAMSFTPFRDAGRSSNAMVEYALGGPFPTPKHFPRDASDMAACHTARNGAPQCLWAAMDEVLAAYPGFASGSVDNGLSLNGLTADELADRLTANG